MPVDLRDLWARSRSLPGTREQQDEVWWDAVRQHAQGVAPDSPNGDLLCYALYVHGNQAEELRSLAFSRHALVMAADLEASRLTTHILPPEHGKTSMARWETEMWLGIETTRAYADANHTVPSAHYIMNTMDQAAKQIMEIEETLEHNKRYKELYPTVKPDKRLGWTKDHFFLQRPRSRPDPSLQGCGMFGPIQGSRVGMQTVDDPTDQQDARSDSLLKAQAEWLLGTAADRVIKNGIRRFRMTRWSERDTFSRIANIKGTIVRVMPCLDYWGPGEALWPDIWNARRLETKRTELIDTGQAYLWALTWMCSPSVAQGDMFQRSWAIYGQPPKVEAAA